MKKSIKLLSMLLTVCFIIGSTAAPAYAKTYKADKVTSKQIVNELKKSFKIHKVHDYTDNDYKSEDGVDYSEYFEHPNNYKSKTNFYDKRYKTYCTVEVYEDDVDAGARLAFLDALNYFDKTLGLENDTTGMNNFRYKNVVIRLSNGMTQKEALKYYKKLKKIIK